METKYAQVLITGASRGIGRAFAKVCAQDKAFLHLVVRKKDPDLIKEMEEAGATSVTLWTADLSSRHSVEKLVEATAHLKIDILFNNAGVLSDDLLSDHSLDEIYEVFQVNLLSLVHLTRAFLPGMQERLRGKIINNASISAFMPVTGSTLYGSSKAAVVAFTEALKNELYDSPVTTLLLVTPGVKTKLYDDIMAKHKKSLERLPVHPLSPHTFAQMIREAVLLDVPTLEPSGLTGLGVKIAKYAPQLFERVARRGFQ